MGRHKGFKMSEDHKRAISEGHKRRHQEEVADNGSSLNFFGFLSSIRKRF